MLISDQHATIQAACDRFIPTSAPSSLLSQTKTETRTEGWTEPLSRKRQGCSGLYHRADCVERGVESDSFGLGRLHVGVIHRVLKRRLSIGALVANVAIELDFGTRPGRKNREKMA